MFYLLERDSANHAGSLNEIWLMVFRPLAMANKEAIFRLLALQRVGSLAQERCGV
jgi:hypothetical protein